MRSIISPEWIRESKISAAALNAIPCLGDPSRCRIEMADLILITQKY